MTPEKLEIIRGFVEAGLVARPCCSEFTRSVQMEAELIAYVDELIVERDRLNEHRLLHHDAIIEISKLREVVAAADALLWFLTESDHKLRPEEGRAWDAFRAARRRLDE